MPDPFGGFGWICRHAPLPQCNLFFSQLWRDDSHYLTTLFSQKSKFFANYSITGESARNDPASQTARFDAGTGVGANCEIAHVGHRGSVGDIALVILSALSLILVLVLSFLAGRRKAAVGRTELRILLYAFGVHTALQIVTMSSLLEQGSTALAVLSSIHVGVIAVLFWILLANALVATQVVEDGTPAAIVPMGVLAVLFFLPTIYISLDTSLHWTDAFVPNPNDVRELRATALFVLTLLWPALATLLYVGIMMYVILVMLREVKPALLYLLAAGLFVGSQVIFFLASQPLCDTSNGKVNGAFLATLLSTGAIGIIYTAWRAITEEDWGDDYYQ